MTEDRPYRRALAAEEAIAELLANAGRQFDPDCVDVLLTVLAERERQEEALPLHRPT
jgi:HD-GYP domain-containing protein (c-di-GMP phosphodiesterase class II)